jgi:hypothetical protein
MCHPQVVQANMEAEDFLGAFCELLCDAVRVPRLVKLTIRGREDQPIIGQAHKAQIHVCASWRASYDTEISFAEFHEQGDQRFVQHDRTSAAIALWYLELQAEFFSVAEVLDIDTGYFYDEIPKTKRSGEIETPALTELAVTLHGRRMVDAFLNLKNDKMRGAVADLVQSLAR